MHSKNYTCGNFRLKSEKYFMLYFRATYCATEKDSRVFLGVLHIYLRIMRRAQEIWAQFIQNGFSILHGKEKR